MAGFLVVATTVVACGADDPLSPRSLAGTYALFQVDGYSPGRFRQMGTIDCIAAFTAGSLRVEDDGTFRLELDYDYRCFEGNGYDGSSSLVVAGSKTATIDRRLYLTGCGPPTGLAESCPNWVINLEPSLPMLTVRFSNDAGVYWRDPVLTMGPRQ